MTYWFNRASSRFFYLHFSCEYKCCRNSSTFVHLISGIWEKRSKQFCRGTTACFDVRAVSGGGGVFRANSESHPIALIIILIHVQYGTFSCSKPSLSKFNIIEFSVNSAPPRPFICLLCLLSCGSVISGTCLWTRTVTDRTAAISARRGGGIRLFCQNSWSGKIVWLCLSFTDSQID